MIYYIKTELKICYIIIAPFASVFMVRHAGGKLKKDLKKYLTLIKLLTIMRKIDEQIVAKAL